MHGEQVKAISCFLPPRWSWPFAAFGIQRFESLSSPMIPVDHTARIVREAVVVADDGR